MIYRRMSRNRAATRPVSAARRRPSVRRGLLAFSVLLALLGGPLAAFGQYENVVLPVDTIEYLFRYGEMRLAQMRDTRFEGDRTQVVVLVFPGYMPLRAKWAAAPRGGERPPVEGSCS